MGFKNRLVADTLNYFVSKIVPGLMGLLTVMVFVRLVGYEQYGRYAVLFALVTACSTGGAGWLSQGILRFQSQYAGTSQEPAFEMGSQVGLLLSCLVGGAAVCALSWRTPGSPFWTTLATLFLFLPMLAYTVELARMQASLQSGRVVWVESLRALASFFIPVALIYFSNRKSFMLLLAGVGVGYLVPLLTRFKRVKHVRLGTGSFFEERQVLKTIWSYGWPIALWLGSQQALVVSDRYFIERFWGYSQAGVYASVYDVIVRSLSLIFAPITLSVHSILMFRWNQGERKGTVNALRRAIGYEFLLFIPVPVFLFLLRPWATQLILGKQNPDAARTLIPLAISGFLWQLALLAHKPLEMLCRTKRMLFGILCALGFNVVGNILLVPRLGFIGAAYTAMGSACLYLLLLCVLVPTGEFVAASRERSHTIARSANETRAWGVFTHSRG